MKKSVVALLWLALMMIALPVAARGNDPVGTRIDVLRSTPTTFPAGYPFHIQHGFFAINSSTRKGIGQYDFKLEIDGEFVRADFRLFDTEVVAGETTQEVWWLFNFPEGLTAGDHTFTGHWYLPCYLTPGPCATPNEKVETHSNSLTVTFN